MPTHLGLFVLDNQRILRAMSLILVYLLQQKGPSVVFRLQVYIRPIDEINLEIFNWYIC